MQRRIGQHHAHIAVFTQVRQPRRLLLEQHDRPLPALQDARLVLAHLADRPGAAQVAAHDGEGLLVALLAPPQPGDDRRIAAGAGEMHAAEALDGHDLPGPEHLAGSLQRRLVPVGTRALRVPEPEMRPADRAAVRLGVVAAVFDVVVFPLAVGTHGEAPHGGERTVVGHVFDDGEAGAAVGAVEEGVAVSPVARIEQLLPAVLTETDVRGDEGVALLFHQTRQDREALTALDRQAPTGLHALDDGQLRRPVGKRFQKRFQRRALALQLQHHAGGAVADRAAQPALAYLAVHEGAKANALYDPVDLDLQVLQSRLRND